MFFFLILYIIISIKRLKAKYNQNLNPKGQSIYNDYIFLFNNSICFNNEKLEVKPEKIEKTKNSSDNTIYIGIFSLIKEINNYKLDISGCRAKKIIKNKLKFELSIKNIKTKIICGIPKLNSTEIKDFDINCKIKKNEYFIMMDDIILNEVPTLKGVTFKGFERYIPRISRKR